MSPEGNMIKRAGICVFLVFVCVAALTLPVFVNEQDAGSPTAPAPQGARSNPLPVFRASSRLVLLDVIVTDRHGQFVPGLQSTDFTVLEDHKPQKISSFAFNLVPAHPATYPPIALPPHQ